ncbi:nuclear distribution protein nudE homolog 1 isoform X2 [Ziziphus jujuba]|uniref:Nuclear distribution protein nudE homolog 1 isoform X2 n=1 Tax=Ziziphus jujuba TaxID=326968 RepID=A0A6P6GPA3_ZIZJJ|nr:nuclear distribution protein nudE homolog 1 isoform X2 [Ziziphus jujuba]
MGKQSKAKRSDTFGKGKVTPVHIAFIVDRYLSDNKFSETHSVFRNEASSLLSRSPVQEVPKSLLSLATMLNEYIILKEQKVMVDQERVRLEQENSRIQCLLQGMENVMRAYNASGSHPTPTIPGAAPSQPLVAVPQSYSFSGSPAGFPLHKTPIIHPVSKPSNINSEPVNFLSPITSQPSSNKRKVSKVVLDAPPAAKKSRGKLSAQKPPAKEISRAGSADNAQESAQPSCAPEPSANNCAPSGSLVNGSSVAKCLFNQPSLSIPTNSGPTTPPRANSPVNDKSISPLEVTSIANCSNNNTPEEGTPTRCTVISSKRVTVSPFKQMTYYMERNHCISSSSPVKTNFKRQTKKDHVKGRLDFDNSDELISSDRPIAEEISTSESEKDIDFFDIDLPNLDALGADFNFTDVLKEFDFECEGAGYSCQPAIGASTHTASGSPHEPVDDNMGVNQVMSEFSSTVTEVLKDVNVQGPDSLTAMKSFTRCIKIISPVKNRGTVDQNSSARN